jgi:hypothetical protein
MGESRNGWIFLHNSDIIAPTILKRRKSMRYLVVAGVLALMATVVGVQGALATGYVAVGKEECKCDPLIARGVVPDTLNKLHHALVFPTIISLLDKISVEGRAILAQFRADREVVATSDEALTPPEKAEEKKEPTVAPKKKPTKKKRVKVPPRAL